ncbi:MAG: ABC transporter permease, partial [Nonomuraea sp.]|nr:ABC transporter permease [Nonomuraea sp.]
MIGRTVLRIVGPLVPAVIIVVALWWAFLEVFQISPLVGKRPYQVWDYLTSDASASVFDQLGITIRDAL